MIIDERDQLQIPPFSPIIKNTCNHTIMPESWSDFTIRTITPDDLEMVLHHRRSMFYDMGNTDVSKLDAVIATSRPFFAERLANGRYKGWFVENAEGRVIAGGGLIINDNHASPIDPNPRRPLVVNMYTEHEYRRRGIAKKLMEVMIEWCRAEGFGTVILHASNEGKPLYESLGFQQTNEMRLKL